MRTLPSRSPEPPLQAESSGMQSRWRTKVRLILVVQAVVLLLGLLDYATGVKLQFAIIYLAPISFAALRGGLVPGVVTCVTSTVVWFAAGAHGGAGFGTGWVAWWEG